MGLGLRLGDAPYDFVEDGWAGAGDAVSGMGVGFHPGEEEDERNPAADVVFELGADLVESGEELDRETNGGDFQHAGIGAVRGGRGDQVFAADERADGVDGAGLIDQERAGDALVEIVNAHLLVDFCVVAPVFLAHIDQAIEDAAGGKSEQRLVKAIGELLLGGFRLGVNPVSECFRLKDADGDELPAACAAAGFAGDGVAGFLISRRYGMND